MSNVDLYKTFS